MFGRLDDPGSRPNVRNPFAFLMQDFVPKHFGQTMEYRPSDPMQDVMKSLLSKELFRPMPGPGLTRPNFEDPAAMAQIQQASQAFAAHMASQGVPDFFAQLAGLGQNRPTNDAGAMMDALMSTGFMDRWFGGGNSSRTGTMPRGMGPQPW